MRILILSFYYQPDLSAGSFRNTALVDQLIKHSPPGSHIDVIATLPNRYAQYSVQALRRENGTNFTIHRIDIPSHKNGMVDQSKAFLKYACDALSIAKKHDYDLVYASSSRLMTATLGALIARQKQIPLYLDIRDLFRDTLKDVLPRGLAIILTPLISVIENLTFKAASTINIVSEGFQPHFEAKYPGKKLSFFTNGIDEIFVNCARPASQKNRSHVKSTVLYAGNIGAGQGLHKIIPQLAQRLGNKIHFKVIGDGGQIQHLKDTIAAFGLENVEVLPPMDRQKLTIEYELCDILFLHLNDHKAFEKVLPSKLFEYAAVTKPIWAGLSGYSARFCKAEISNCTLFEPTDIESAIESFANISFSMSPRSEFIRKFNRRNIMSVMATEILDLAKNNT